MIDLDIEGSPEICKNVLKLAKARYYTSTLVYNIQPNRFCQLGDAQGDGKGGACIYGLIECNGDTQKVLQSHQRFLKSNKGRPLTEAECQEKGRLVATEMNGIPDTIGSQLLLTISEGPDMALDGFTSMKKTDNGDGQQQRQLFRSVGVVTEDENNVLDQIAATYCDADGRPYADIRVKRALIIDDPFEDPPGMDELLQKRGVVMDDDDEKVTASPDYERPPDESVEIRIQADQIDPLTGEEDIKKMKQREEELLKREDKSRAVVLEMLGDLPSAEATAPENVLFVCKLNPVTEDEDLELIFSRFDEKVKAEIIRDHDTGSSLQYAFVEFTTKEQAVEAYFKMNNALVDDRRIKVDFSQSVAKVWNKYAQRTRNPTGKRSNHDMPRDPFGGERQPRQSHGNRGRQPNNSNRDHGLDPYRNDHRAPHYHGRGVRHHHRDNRPPSSQQAHFGSATLSEGDERSHRHHRKPSRDHNRHERDHHDRKHRSDSPSRGKHEHGEESDSLRSDRHRRDLRARSRSRSRSREQRDRKHRKHHHKSRRHHKSSRRDDGHHRRRSHDDRSPSPKRRSGGSGGEDNTGKSSHRDRNSRDERSPHRRVEESDSRHSGRDRDGKREHKGSKREHRDGNRSKRHRSRSRSVSGDERRKRRHDENRRRHRDRHRGEDHHRKRRRDH